MIFLASLDQRPRAARKYVLAVVVSLLACVTPLYAQQGDEITPRKVEAKAMFGGAAFDDDTGHTLVGGAVRAYVTKRISIEPEYLYLRNSNTDQDHLVGASVAYDFATDRTQRLVAYAIGGVGILHHQSSFVSNDFTTWSASAGVGAKIFVTKRLFLSPEFRLGREPMVRATISVGYAFGGER